MRSVPTVWSIGYEKAALRDFIPTLQRAGIAALIDTRNLPLSRRAGFSKRQLRAAVEEAGIAYHHLQALGTPKDGRVAAQRRDWGRFWAIVERQLASPEAALDLERAAAIAREAPSCLLCYEADWRVCHRRRVCELLAERHGFAATHLHVDPGFAAD